MIYLTLKLDIKPTYVYNKRYQDNIKPTTFSSTKIQIRRLFHSNTWCDSWNRKIREKQNKRTSTSILGRKELYTLPIATQAFYGTYSTDIGLVMAALLLAMLPILVLFPRRGQGTLHAGQYHHEAYKKRFIDSAEEKAQPNISREKILIYPFVLPPYNEQIRISKKLDFILKQIFC